MTKGNGRVGMAVAMALMMACGGLGALTTAVEQRTPASITPSALGEAAPWTDSFDDLGHVYVPPGGLVGTEVAGGEARLMAGMTEGWIASSVITCPADHRYDLVYIEAEIPGASSIKVSVLNASREPTEVGYANDTVPGFGKQHSTPDVSVMTITPTAYPQIRIQVNLYAAGADRPRLLSWSLFFVGLEEWRDEFLGKSKMLDDRGINLTAGRAEVNLSKRGAGGVGEYDAYPTVAVSGAWGAGLAIYYPNAGHTAYNDAAVLGGSSSGVDIADIDQDGNLDLASAAGDSVTVYWGDGTGTWTGSSANVAVSANDANRVKAGDLNADGYLDLAIGCNAWSGSADSQVYMNTGGRTFAGTPVMKLTGVEYTSCLVGDINEDGYADVIFGSGSNLKAYYGSASGPSTGNVLTFTISGCNDLYLRDLDGDGHLDLLAGGKSGGKMPIFLGSDGGMDTTADFSLTVPSDLRAVAAGDINGDGYMDIAEADGGSGGTWYFFEGDASGWSDARKHTTTVTSTYMGAAADCIDVDKDGYDELLCTLWEGSGYVMKVLKGGTTWPTTSSFQKGSAGGGDMAFAVVRDSSGRYFRGSFTTQAITIDPAVKKWDVLVVEGATPLNTTLSVSVLDNADPKPQPISGYKDLAAWDVDLSGLTGYPIIHVKVDITSEFNWTTPVLDRMFIKWMDRGTWREEFFGGAKVERTLNVGVADWQLGRATGMGTGPQLLVTSLRSDLGFDVPPVAFVDGGSLDYARVAPIAFESRGVSAADVADVNGDGFLDVAFAVRQTGDNIYDAMSPVFLGSAVGFKAQPDHRLPTVGATDVVLRDLDRDGDVDVVFSQETDGTTARIDSALFWGAPGGGWNGTADLKFQTSSATGVAAADMNGDGRADLAFSCYKEASSTTTDSMVFLQSANGFCGTVPSYSLQTKGAMAVAAADVDGDTHVDLAFANQFSAGMSEIDSYVYWGKAGGGFEATPLLLRTMGADDVKAADLDGDSDLDLIFANLKNNVPAYRVDSYVFLNGGSRAFGATPDARLPTTGAVAVAVADLDGTGRKDLVFACQYNGTGYDVRSVVYLGAASGWSAAPDIVLPTMGASDVVVANLVRAGQGGYMSKAIRTERPDDTGAFNTLRYTATLGANQAGTVSLIDATTWDLLAQTALQTGTHSWLVRDAFKFKEHPSVRVVVTVSGLDKAGAFILDDLSLNWTKRVKQPPQVLGIEVRPQSLLRLNTGTITLNVTDEYDLTKDLRVSVETRLNGTTLWTAMLFSGTPTFSAGAWHIAVFPRADADVGSHDVRVQVMDFTDLMYSGYVEFPNALAVLNNLPSAPEVRIIPDNPITTLTLQASIVTPARDAESGALTYRYRWFLDGTLVDTITTDTVPAALTERGQNWTVEVRAFDGLNDSLPAVAWTVIVNAPPQMKTPLPSPEIREDEVDDQWIDLSKAFEDPDGDVMTFRVDPTPEHFQVTIDGATGKVTLRPAENWNGQESIIFHASDGFFSTFQTALVTVTAVNDRPMFQTVNGAPITVDPVALSVNQGERLDITIVAADVEGDELVFSVNTTAITVDDATGQMTFEPGNEQVGILRFALFMYDTATPSAKVTLNFTINVVNINDPMDAPRIINPKLGDKFKVGTTFSLIGACTDPDTQYGQKLTFTWYWNTSNLIGEGTSLTTNFTAPGTYNLTLKVSDGEFEKSVYVIITIDPKDIPAPPPPPIDQDDDGGISLAMIVGILVVLIVIGGVIFLVMTKRREEAKEAEEEKQEKHEALKHMAAEVKATADQMELELGRTAGATKAGGVRTGELEEVVVEQKGPGGESAMLTAKGMEEGMLTMRPKETEAASKETMALFKDMARTETAASAADQDKMRVDNEKRKYATAIGRMPYGIPAPDLRNMDWNDLAALLATGQKRTLPDGHETTMVKGKWYYSDPADSSTFLKEHGAKPKSEPRRAAAAAPATDKATLLAKLEERFILGEISEDAYKELKRKFESEGKEEKKGEFEWVEE